MKVELEIPDYSENTGIKRSWERGFTIDVQVKNNNVIIKANEAGLISLARQMITLAQSTIPSGFHLHYDESNSLEDGACEIIIEKL